MGVLRGRLLSRYHSYVRRIPSFREMPGFHPEDVSVTILLQIAEDGATNQSLVAGDVDGVKRHLTPFVKGIPALAVEGNAAAKCAEERLKRLPGFSQKPRATGILNCPTIRAACITVDHPFR
jgi:hypothetical protein